MTRSVSRGIFYFCISTFSLQVRLFSVFLNIEVPFGKPQRLWQSDKAGNKGLVWGTMDHSVMEPSLLHKRGCVQRTQFSRVGPGHQPTVPLLCNWLPRPHGQAVESRVHISFENLCWTSTGCGLCQISSKLYVSRYRLIGPHLSLMGPTVWKLCQTFHRTQEFSLCFDDFSGRSIPSLRWGRPAHSSVGLNRRQYD